MSRDGQKLVGFIVGRERELPETVIALINERYPDVQAEMVKLGGTFLDEAVPYDVIIDRMSHEIPYYRTYVKYAALNGCYIINDPFVWANDSKFFAGAVLRRLGIRTPRTMVLPNKDIAADTVPDSFRNLSYPMDWQAIIDYIGGPAIFKDIRSGGRRFAHRVNNVDELLQRYDESGMRTMILQQVIESDQHYHCLVIGGEKTLLLPYSMEAGHYLEGQVTMDEAAMERLTQATLQIAHVYGYDINMSEFVMDGDEMYLINATNPSPLMGRDLMTEAQFTWACEAVAELAVARTAEPRPQWLPVNLPND
ncbi:RimK family alpha-L-glutamate ligase [Promineifilum sp.]|uniref:ATP-grasp domain-containing protein n=1 Tax=Promineifilum sp. TaxID=2664178 RepID=UPI0035B295BA